MTHSFEIDDAKKYGVLAATILYNIRFWLTKNLANKKNIYEGRVWTYNSVRAFSELFSYATPKQIRKALDDLKSYNVLLTGNFNQNRYDRTLWYSLNEESFCLQEEIDLPEKANRFEQKGTPIPDINTDEKPDDSKKDFFETDIGFLYWYIENYTSRWGLIWSVKNDHIIKDLYARLKVEKNLPQIKRVICETNSNIVYQVKCINDICRKRGREKVFQKSEKNKAGFTLNDNFKKFLES